MSMTKTLTPLALAAALLLAGCGRNDPEAMLASARDYLGRNDAPAAIIQLKNALQANPDLAEARLLLGQALLESGDPVGAETELGKAASLGAPADQVTPALVRSRLLQGRSAAVTAEFGNTTLGTPAAQAQLQTLLAQAWRAQGRAAEFEAAVNAALKASPDHEPALLELARLKASKRDIDGALAVIDGLLARRSDAHEALKLKGDLLLAGRRDLPQALAAYRASVQARPGYADGQASVVRALLGDRQVDAAATELEALVKMAPGRPGTLYLQGQLAMARNQPAQAREHVQQLLKLAPDNPAALELGGAVELALNAPVRAESLLAKAVATAPDLRLARRLLVTSYLRTGQVDRALAALPANLSNDDADPALLLVAGQAHMVKGQADQAQAYFARAARLDPADASKRTALAVSQLAAGKTDAAINALETIAASDDGISADLALINAHLRLRQVDEALAAIAALQKKRADDPLPWQLRGRALLLRNDTAGAREAFGQALQRNPDYFAATAALTALDMAARQPEQARQRLQAVIDRQPKNVQALLALADVQAASGAPADTVAALLRQAVQAEPAERQPRVALVDHYLRRNDPKAALAEAQAAVAALPDAPEVLDALGRAQQASGDTNQALASFNKMQGLMPGNPLPLLRLAGAHAANRDTPAAIDQLRKALALQPDLLPAQRALVELAVRGNQTPLALDTSRQVQKQRPREAAGYVLEAEVHGASKNWGAAAGVLRTGLKAAPAPELVVRLFNVLLADGKAADAERLGADWLRTQPRDAVVPMFLGDRAIAANQLPDARRHYERVIALQPQNAVALNNLAWVSGQQGRDDAVALAERANQIAPDQPAFMDTLAVLLSERNEHARALELQKRVVAMQPQTPLFKFNLARIHIRAGEKAPARALLDELAAMGDRFNRQAEVEALKKGL